MSDFARVGDRPAAHVVLDWFGKVQEFYVLAAKGIVRAFQKPFYIRELIEQMEYAGVNSLPIIGILSLFIGMALTLQISSELGRLGLHMYAGTIVGIAIVSEIGPVMVAVVYAGRTGAGMTSELGSMVLRNQVDTLRVFGVDPIKKLVTPRILSSIIMLPALTVLGDLISLIGGAYIVTVLNNQSPLVYWHTIRLTLLPRYVLPGIVKPVIFGALIGSLACFEGMATHGGAKGLKRTTTGTFVLSTVLIIIADFIITKVILQIVR